MAKNDNAMKIWLRNKYRFADLFNAVIFEGKQIINADDLSTDNVEENIILKEYNSQKIIGTDYCQRFRDVVMKWKNEISLMVLAVEAQDKVQHSMPVRVMLYDALSYTEQIRELYNLRQGNFSGGDIYSSFKKTDHIYPIITIILYYGSSKWDTNIDLYDMFGLTDCELFRKYIPNYGINIFNPSNIDDYSIFKTDMQIVFNMLRFKQDAAALKTFIEENKIFFSAVSEDNKNAITALLHSDNFNQLIDKCSDNNNESEVYDMCKALEDLAKENFSAGEASGFERAQNLAIHSTISLLRKTGTTDTLICKLVSEEYHLQPEQIAMYMQ